MFVGLLALVGGAAAQSGCSTDQSSGAGGADGGATADDGAASPSEGGPESGRGSPAVGPCARPAWSHSLPSQFTGENAQRIQTTWYAVASGEGDSVYAAGRYSGTADVGSGPKGAPASRSITLAKWNETGGLAWDKRFDTTNVSTALTALAAAPGGGIYVGGAVETPLDFGNGKSATGELLSPHAFVAQLSGAGTATWVTSFRESNERVAQIIASGSQLFALITSYSNQFGPETLGRHWHVVRIDPTTGALKTPTYPSGFFFSLPQLEPRMAASPDGGVFLTYQVQQNFDDYPAQLIKIDAAGAVTWTKSFDQDIPGAADRFSIGAIAPDGEGGVVALTRGPLPGFEEPSVSRFGADGVMTWSRKLDRDGAAIHADAKGITVVAAGGPCGDTGSVETWRFAPDGTPGAGSSYLIDESLDAPALVASFGATSIAIAAPVAYTDTRSFIARLLRR